MQDDKQENMIYLHFETEQGTAWAGNFKRQGKGQWYYWSIVDDCK